MLDFDDVEMYEFLERYLPGKCGHTLAPRLNEETVIITDKLSSCLEKGRFATIYIYDVWSSKVPKGRNIYAINSAVPLSVTIELLKALQSSHDAARLGVAC
ncbi:MAG: hypothetical protein A3G59_02325 [Candidatus Taylorbacteria bacterium RIFCSPLOWO2_12_FULL_47_20]|uniref:Uncharacterized protein n=1 Tax=Candidatus Taylorbacteria bacterium RIFCSPLOWO2_12_FULL_47_20 TaxID=1802335 RepID=A0A1G2P865_9BACT|nr:MAG: hypothetical protein A3G59_02325 [Candidatus Taylorbacteria bacterium RIFCSPLOWO2_12_FULL_47_20]